MAQSCDKCTAFFVIDLPFCNFFEDVWLFVKEANFGSGLLLRNLDDTVKLIYMMNCMNDKDYTRLESILYVELTFEKMLIASTLTSVLAPSVHSLCKDTT